MLNLTAPPMDVSVRRIVELFAASTYIRIHKRPFLILKGFYVIGHGKGDTTIGLEEGKNNPDDAFAPSLHISHKAFAESCLAEGKHQHKTEPYLLLSEPLKVGDQFASFSYRQRGNPNNNPA